MSIRLSKIEQETIITFNALEDTANIFSCDPVWMRKIQKIKGSKVCGVGMEVDVPKKWVKIQPTKKLSPETKAELSARMKTMRAKQVAASSKKARTQK